MNGKQMHLASVACGVTSRGRAGAERRRRGAAGAAMDHRAMTRRPVAERLRWYAALLVVVLGSVTPLHMVGGETPVALVSQHVQHGDYKALSAAVNTTWTFVLDEPPPSAAVLQTVTAVVGIPLPSPLLAHTTNAEVFAFGFTGYDEASLSLIPKHMAVTNCHQSAVPIAEYVLAAVFRWSVQLAAMDAAFRACTWKDAAPGNTCGNQFEPGSFMHRDVAGATIGILGYGAIGSAIGVRAAAMGMRVIGTTLNPPATPPPGVAWLKADAANPQLMAESDFLVLACPLTTSTRGMINSTLLSLMKPTGVLINIARGAVVDEEALYTVLLHQQIGGAVLDVWWQSGAWMKHGSQGPASWPSRFPFDQLANVVITSHTSSATPNQNSEGTRELATILDAVALHQPLPSINIVRNATAVERSLEKPRMAASLPTSAKTYANSSRWKQDKFAISFFAQTHPPPIDDASFKLMANGNFTAVGLFDHLHSAITPELTARQQALCEKYNLKCLLRLDSFTKAKDGSHPKLPQLSPTQWGYYLSDEPNALTFPSLANEVASVRKAAPGSMSFINLLPANVSGEHYGYNATGWAHEWGAANYSAYVQALVDVVKPDVVCFDSYPNFGRVVTDADSEDTREDYVTNLRIVSAIATKAELPMWLYFNIVPYGSAVSMPHEGHSDPTEAQVRWQIFTALAHGATGLLYFEWHPMTDGHPGLVQSATGPPIPSAHYSQAKRLNTWVLALAPTLLRAKLTKTEDLRYDHRWPQIKQDLNISRGSWTLGYFKLHPSTADDSDGGSGGATRAVMIVNYEHAFTQWATVDFGDRLKEIDSVSGKPVQVEDDAPDIPGLQLLFAPGEGRLFTFE